MKWVLTLLLLVVWLSGFSQAVEHRMGTTLITKDPMITVDSVGFQYSKGFKFLSQKDGITTSPKLSIDTDKIYYLMGLGTKTKPVIDTTDILKGWFDVNKSRAVYNDDPSPSLATVYGTQINILPPADSLLRLDTTYGYIFYIDKNGGFNGEHCWQVNEVYKHSYYKYDPNVWPDKIIGTETNESHKLISMENSRRKFDINKWYQFVPEDKFQ